MSIPPIAGPTNLAILKQEAFKEIALDKSFLSSTRRTNVDCLKGASIAAIQFKNTPRTIITGIFINPVTVKSVINKACKANKSCTAKRSL